MFHVANVGIPQAKCTQNLFGALGLAVGGSKSENDISVMGNPGMLFQLNLNLYLAQKLHRTKSGSPPQSSKASKSPIF